MWGGRGGGGGGEGGGASTPPPPTHTHTLPHIPHKRKFSSCLDIMVVRGSEEVKHPLDDRIHLQCSLELFILNVSLVDRR